MEVEEVRLCHACVVSVCAKMTDSHRVLHGYIVCVNVCEYVFVSMPILYIYL